MCKKINKINTLISTITLLLGILVYFNLTPGVLSKYFKSLNNGIIIKGIIGLVTLLLFLFLIVYRIHNYFIPEPTKNLEDLVVPSLLERGTYKTGELKYKFRMFLYYGVIFIMYTVIAFCILLAINFALDIKMF